MKYKVNAIGLTHNITRTETENQLIGLYLIKQTTLRDELRDEARQLFPAKWGMSKDETKQAQKQQRHHVSEGLKKSNLKKNVWKQLTMDELKSMTNLVEELQTIK
jgi:predicted AlkP superfamily pyrophosphatase or phosphodiesterase